MDKHNVTILIEFKNGNYNALKRYESTEVDRTA